MKATLFFYAKLVLLIISSSISVLMNSLYAQNCSNPVDSIYSLTTNGELHSVNILNGGYSATLGGSAVLNAVNSNALGFSSANGRFYFFNRTANGDSIEFASYYPLTKTKVLLAKPPAPMTAASSDKVRSGTVNNSGTGYYTILTTSPTTSATLYYYNVVANTWTIITQHFKNASTGASLDSQFHYLNSGDMTFDGTGNLWILASKNPKYALYKVNNPVLTGYVDTLSVNVVLSTRLMPHTSSSASFTGIAFNKAGDLFLGTGSYSSSAVGTMLTGATYTDYNILYRLRTISPLIIDSISKLPNSYADDFTTCFFPYYVLENSFLNFDVTSDGDNVNLNWDILENGDERGYIIESGTDQSDMKSIGFVPKKSSGAKGEAFYSFKQYGLSAGVHYFRVKKVDFTSKQQNSDIKQLEIKTGNTFSLSPNPSGNYISLNLKSTSTGLFLKLYDLSGKLMLTKSITSSNQIIDISSLGKGIYFAQLVSAYDGGIIKSLKLVKL